MFKVYDCVNVSSADVLVLQDDNSEEARSMARWVEKRIRELGEEAKNDAYDFCHRVITRIFCNDGRDPAFVGFPLGLIAVLHNPRQGWVKKYLEEVLPIMGLTSTQKVEEHVYAHISKLKPAKPVQKVGGL